MAPPTADVLFCRGKRCRKEHADEERALRSLAGAARDAGARLVPVDCLGACDDGPVVALGEGGAGRLRYFGRISKEKHVLALCDVVAGRADVLPERLARRALVATGKMDKRAARGLRDAG